MAKLIFPWWNDNVQKLCTQFNVRYLHHMTIWDVYFKVCKVVNISVSISKLRIYTNVNPCNQKKNIPLGRTFHWQEGNISKCWHCKAKFKYTVAILHETAVKHGHLAQSLYQQRSQRWNGGLKRQHRNWNMVLRRPMKLKSSASALEENDRFMFVLCHVGRTGSNTKRSTSCVEHVQI